MKRKNATRNALVTNIISLLLCVSMLVGTTFAWFTDSVESGMNTITAGNLDVELYHSDKGAKDEKVTASTILFDDVTLWEPGAVAYENLQVKNEGNLALKYQLVLSFANATENGAGKTLADVLKVAVVKGGFNGDRAAAHALTYNYDLASFSLNGQLEKGQQSDIFGIVIYWEPTANDNEFNMNNENKGKVLSIDLGVNLFATQEMYEEDSFDDTYDKDTEVFTVAEANAMLAENKDVTLVNCVDREGVINVPAGYTGKLILKNSTIASVQAEAAANITILGNVTVDATALANTSAITGTEINIIGNGNLTAIASGDHAYGIGGDQTTAITIEGVHIVDVKGGHVQPNFINDTSYGKSEPEGGAAIGSGTSGAVITLNDVTIDNAQGGSKAAGIGGRFWTGVTININNSIIKNVEGGNASAGIGGSRVSDDVAPADQHVKINITNSSINATGGQFGAGIGSGYDTYCGKNITETICTINIDAASSITAQGGKYAAGVGTGYHVAALAGNIECAVNATAGESREKYTIAQAVGFGVVDHTREVSYLTTAPSITYQGTVITVPGAQITNADELAAALEAGETEIALAAGTYTIPTAAQGKELTFTGTKDTVIDITKSVNLSNSKITFDGVTVKSDGSGHANGIQHVDTVTYNNVTVVGSRSLYGNKEVFNNCTFDLTGISDYIWTYGAKEVEFNNCTFNTLGKAILIYNESADLVTKVTVTGCTFNATQSAYAGDVPVPACAAIEINSSLSTNGHYTLTTSGNTVDSDFSGEWRIKKSADSNVTVNGTAYSAVTVDGKIFASDGLYTDTEGNYYVYNAAGLNSLKTWMDSHSNNAFWGKTYNIMADIDASTVTWNTNFISPDSTTFNGITFNGNGHTISNLTINGQGLFSGATQGSASSVPAAFKDITFDNVTVNGGTHHNGVVWGEAYGDITLNNVSVINSKVSGGCNVGALVGRNFDHSVIKFIDCAVKNTIVEATQAADYAGASAFLGMALNIGETTSIELVFEGNNVSEGNTLTTASGMQGGGIYTIATWGEATWETPTVVNDFTNYDSNN